MSNVSVSTVSLPLVATKWVASAFDAVLTAVAQHFEYRRTVSELSKLNARELNDLGLNQYDIKSVAHKLVYGA